MRTLLFLDDHYVDETYNLSRRLNRPRKAEANPVLTATEEWEATLCAYGSVILDENVFKMFYTMWWLQDAPPYSCEAEALAYAHGDDGVNWVKPRLHLVPEVNRGENNLIRYGRFADQPSVIKLARPEGGKNFVMAYYGDFPPLGQGVRLCYSEDGVRWDWPGTLVWKTALDEAASRIDFYAADDTLSFYFDEGRNKYVLLRKVMQDSGLVYDPERHADWLPDEDALRRSIARCESGDLVRWERHQIILAPDRDDPPDVDFHRLSVTPYGEEYVGLLEVRDGSPEKNTTELHLVHSRDGIKWARPCRGQQPFIGAGAEDSWDGGLIFTTPRFWGVGEALYFYYGGMQARLTAESLGTCRLYGVGLATLEKDRFCSLSASRQQAGLLLTTPLGLEVGVGLNAVVREGGSLQAALCDADARPLDGFGWGDCDPCAGDLNGRTLTWKGRGVPRPGTYRLHLRGRDVDLYALYI